VDVPPTWGGSFWDRPRLTGSWFGLRDELGKRGVVLGNFVPFLRQQLDLGLQKEDAVELYYNASITKWLTATLDPQIISPALKKTLGSARQLEDVNTSVVAGLRLYARF